MYCKSSAVSVGRFEDGDSEVAGEGRRDLDAEEGPAELGRDLSTAEDESAEDGGPAEEEEGPPEEEGRAEEGPPEEGGREGTCTEGGRSRSDCETGTKVVAWGGQCAAPTPFSAFVNTLVSVVLRVRYMYTNSSDFSIELSCFEPSGSG